MVDSVQAADPGLRLLALDGAPIPSTEAAQLYALKTMVALIDQENKINNVKRSSRVCDNFDLIGGTGAGGIFAIFFAIFEMTVRQAIEAYSTIEKYVFSSDHWDDPDPPEALALLEFMIGKIGREYGINVDSSLLDSSRRCKVFVCTVDSDDPDSLCLLRSYPVASNITPRCSIKNALRAAIAGDPFLQPVRIGSPPRPLANAVHRLSNPTSQTIEEAYGAFGHSKSLHCIYSVGAGHTGGLSVTGEAMLALLEALACSSGGDSGVSVQHFVEMGNFVVRLSAAHGWERQFLPSPSVQSATSTKEYFQTDFREGPVSQYEATHRKKVHELFNQLVRKEPTEDHAVSFYEAKRKETVLPRCPTVLIGRVSQKSLLVNFLTSKVSSVLLGRGGIGKTSLALSVMHDWSVKAAFKFRYFVNCDGLTSLPLFYLALSESIGISVHHRDPSELKEVVSHCLCSDESLLCIDGFESLWDIEETRSAVQDALTDLFHIRKLTILLTMRGTEPPGPFLQRSDSAISLDLLEEKYAFNLFMVNSHCAPDDKYARMLFKAVEAVPLLVQLLGEAASGPDGSPEDLWNRWEKKRTKAGFLRGERRVLDLNDAIELVLNSQQLKKAPAVREAIALLSILPTGLFQSGEIIGMLSEAQKSQSKTLSKQLIGGLKSLLMRKRSTPKNVFLPSISSLSTLWLTSLIYIDIWPDRPGRYRLVAPVVRYARDNLLHLLSKSTKRLLVQVYVDFIKDRPPDVMENHAVVTPELPNLLGILELAVKEGLSSIRDYTIAVRLAVEWMNSLGLPPDSFLQAMIVKHCELHHLKHMLPPPCSDRITEVEPSSNPISMVNDVTENSVERQMQTEKGYHPVTRQGRRRFRDEEKDTLDLRVPVLLADST